MRLCDLNTAKALQEIGYDEACMDYYLHGKLNGIGGDGAAYPFGLWEDFNAIGKEDLRTDLYSAPRIDDAAYWIRDKHRISIETLWWPGSRQWEACANDMDAENLLHFSCQDEDYDTALEAAVKRAINLIKNR